MHVRKQIRDRAATTLTGLPTTGASVFKMRKYALDDARLPALCVYTMDEASALVTIGSRTLRRNLVLVVEATAKGSSETVYDNVDAICAEVEAALAADFTLNGIAKSVILTATETDVNIEGEKGLGSATMRFDVTYITSIEDAETAR